jgi:hypothetical protein
MIDQLRSIGIFKGRPFKPDRKMQDLLETAAQEAWRWLDAHYEDVFDPPFFAGTHWAIPAIKEVLEGLPDFFSDPDAYPLDGRGVTYSMAYFSAKHMGAGQYYLMAVRDRDGAALDGSKTYRLRVPSNAPAKLYWSFTAYDRGTHALIRNAPRCSRASNSPGLVANADGSVDLWFAPKAPDGREQNWVPTSAGRGFEVLFRIYGPEVRFFNKEWVLPDLEKVG